MSARPSIWLEIWEMMKAGVLPGMSTHQMLVDMWNAHVDEFEHKPRRIEAALTAEYRPVLSRWPRGVMEPGDISDRLDAEYCR